MEVLLLFIALYLIFRVVSDNKTRSIEETEEEIQRVKSRLIFTPIILIVIVAILFIATYMVNLIMPEPETTITLNNAVVSDLKEKILSSAKIFFGFLVVMIEVFYIFILTSLQSRLENLKKECVTTES